VGARTLLEIAVAEAYAAGITSVFVTSDSRDILDSIQKQFLSTNLILRSPSAATDSATAREVVQDFLDQAPTVKESDYIAYLQPTSPLRKSCHIKAAISWIDSGLSSKIVSVVSSPYPNEKVVSIVNEKIVVPDGANPSGNRQDFEPAFYPNGAIYIFLVEEFLQAGEIPVHGAMALEMDKFSSIDIDSIEDLELARLIFKSESI
jgi:N-acylneuraminate cytidylyltransferase